MQLPLQFLYSSLIEPWQKERHIHKSCSGCSRRSLRITDAVFILQNIVCKISLLLLTVAAVVVFIRCDSNTGHILSVVSADEQARNVNDPSLEGRKIIWMGRMVCSVSLYDARSGKIDGQFPAAECRMRQRGTATTTGRRTRYPSALESMRAFTPVVGSSS